MHFHTRRRVGRSAHTRKRDEQSHRETLFALPEDVFNHVVVDCATCISNAELFLLKDKVIKATKDVLILLKKFKNNKIVSFLLYLHLCHFFIINLIQLVAMKNQKPISFWIFFLNNLISTTTKI